MPRTRDEQGIAIVMAMFMTLIVSALAASMAYMARTETLSSHSYTTMAQARYGAESGVAAAAHYLLSSQYDAVAPGTASDPLSNYNLDVSPVTRGGGGTGAVLLSTQLNASNYPEANGVVQTFRGAASGTLGVSSGTVEYGARATLLAMRALPGTAFGPADPQVLQTWEITGIGRLGGSGSAEVEVTAIIERPTVSSFRYAAFATDDGCNALTFEGGATTGSYDSAAALSGGSPGTSSGEGHVGTNGNLSIEGTNTQIYGTLSTPRAGVGSCTQNNVTAVTIQGKGVVHEGLVELPQPVSYPPPPPWPAAPTTAVNFTKNSGCTGIAACADCSSSAFCAVSTNGATIMPDPDVPYRLGNVVLDGQGELVLHPGTYEVNSLNVSGNSKIRVAGDGPVIIKVTGAGQTSPISITGNSISNPVYNSGNLQLIYAGENNVYVGGGTDTAALIYAPTAYVEVTGNSDFYGAVVGGRVKIPGSAKLYFDTSLSRLAETAGKPVMSSFTWQTF